MEEQKFKVIIVEDVKLELKGTEEIFRHEIPNAEVIGTAMTENEFWPLMEAQLPDLVLLDLGLGGSTTIGVDICRNIFKRYKGVRVLIFTGEILNEKLWVDVLNAGADGIILKTGELLTKTDVQAVMDGKKLVFNYPILEKIVDRFKKSVANDAKRQEAVISYDIDEYDERFLRHLALGYTKEMIASLKGMPFGVKSLEKRQNDLIGRLFPNGERVGVNATRLAVRALELLTKSKLSINGSFLLSRKMMKNKWRMPHPATMFLLLTMAVVFLSWICDIYGLKVTLPQTGEDIRVQSLLSPEGIRWWLRNAIKNFTGFAPLGMVIIAMFGLGVAQHSGFIGACIRLGVGNRKEKRKVILWVIVLGLLSNVIGDGGYIILLPIAAMLFQWVGLHPLAGIITAYVSVACGYSANIVLSTMDPLLAHTTQEAALAQTGYQGNTEPLCNYFFMSASTVVITAIVYWLTQKWLLPALGKYEGSVKVEAYRPLSRKERRAIMISIIVAGIYVALILWLTFSSHGILRGVNGGLMHSPFIAGILFLLSLGAGITGMAYGFSSGRYRSDNDVIEGLTQPMKLLGVYFVIAFFAAQMFACFEYSHLDKCLAIMGADLLSSFEPAPLSALVLFILFTAFINLIMVSATSKWAFMSFIFIPMFAQMGISPDIAQCAFRIGDSSTNAITPFMFYMPLVLTYMRQYDKQVTYGTLLKYTWRYSVGILAAWTLFFIIWYLLRIPMGL